MIMKILYVDDNHAEIKNITDLFKDHRLASLYDYDYIHCPMGAKSWDDQQSYILAEINKKKFGINILMMDMILTGEPINGTPMSLEIAEMLKGNPSNTFDIIFVTGYTNKNELLTQDEKWDNKKYLHRDKPELTDPLPEIPEGYCPPAQGEKCHMYTSKNCTHRECFIQYLKMYSEGKIEHD